MKDLNPPNAEQELSSEEVERLAQTIFGPEIPVRENLAEELEAARKRVEACERGD